MADDSGEIVREAAESVAFANVKTIGEAGSFYTGLSFGNAVANQQAQYQLGLAITSKAAEMIMATSPSEGGADTAALRVLESIANSTPSAIPAVNRT